MPEFCPSPKSKSISGNSHAHHSCVGKQEKMDNQNVSEISIDASSELIVSEPNTDK